MLVYRVSNAGQIDVIHDANDGSCDLTAATLFRKLAAFSARPTPRIRPTRVEPPAVSAHPSHSMAKPSAVPASFEAALAELEEIVATMEGGQLPLKESLAAYKRGAELLQYLPDDAEGRRAAGPGARKRRAEGIRSRRCGEAAPTTMNPDLAWAGLVRRAPAADRGRARRALLPAADLAPASLQPRDALCGARRRQADAAAAGVCGGRGHGRESRRRRRRRRRRRADPRLFAGPRRPAVHGRRHAAPRQADVPRRVRRGDGTARRRRAAGARVRRAGRGRHARSRRACAVLADAAGVRGMAGGQAIDLDSVGATLSACRARNDAPDEDRRADSRRRAAGRRAAAGR